MKTYKIEVNLSVIDLENSYSTKTVATSHVDRSLLLAAVDVRNQVTQVLRQAADNLVGGLNVGLAQAIQAESTEDDAAKISV